MGRPLCKFNGVGVIKKASGTGTGARKSERRIEFFVVWVREERQLEPGWERDRLFGGKKSARRRQVVRGTE